MKKYIRSNDEIGTYRGVTYGMEDSGDQRFYFFDKNKKIHYADLEEELFAEIDAMLDQQDITASEDEELVNVYVKTEQGWSLVWEGIPESKATAIWKAGFATGENKVSIETESGRRISKMNRQSLK